jgi:alpha-glucosidase (family GH31 glycosyl hydrolase)
MKKQPIKATEQKTSFSKSDFCLPETLKETIELKKRLTNKIEEMQKELSNVEYQKKTWFEMEHDKNFFGLCMKFQEQIKRHHDRQVKEYEDRVKADNYLSDKLKEIKQSK